MPSQVEDSIRELHNLLSVLPGELAKISDGEAARLRSDGGWSRKQILGHLIDSATVNHQRFLRAQLETGFSFLYEQNQWVELQRYQQRSWSELIAIWTALNRHLLYTIDSLAEDKLQNLCGRGNEQNDDGPWTLAYRIPDYLHHMQHHLEQIRRFE